MFTAGYELIPYIKQITFRLEKVKIHFFFSITNPTVIPNHTDSPTQDYPLISSTSCFKAKDECQRVASIAKSTDAVNVRKTLKAQRS